MALVLLWFEASLGLQIDLNKSELILIGEVLEVEELAPMLSCEVGKLHTAYLSLPQGAPFKASPT